MKMADLPIFKNWAGGMIFIWVIDIYMVCYGKQQKKFCETLLGRYDMIYKNVLKNVLKIKWLETSQSVFLLFKVCQLKLKLSFV